MKVGILGTGDVGTTLGTASQAVVQAAGPESFKAKVVIDTTNPLDFSKGFPPGLAFRGTTREVSSFNGCSLRLTW
jgi:predicted dinucleotide-binding enzyme